MQDLEALLLTDLAPTLALGILFLCLASFGLGYWFRKKLTAKRTASLENIASLTEARMRMNRKARRAYDAKTQAAYKKQNRRVAS